MTISYNDLTTETRKTKHHGWECKTRVRLPGIIQKADLGYDKPNPAFLEITTYKGSRGIASLASVVYVGDGFVQTAIGADLHSNVRTPLAGRATEKSVATYHDESLKHIGEILAAVENHYGVDPLVEPEVEPAE